MNTIFVVAGIVINPVKEILIALRPSHVPQGDLWEFPGGKVEKNEKPFDALRRELHEETDIDVISARPFICVEHLYPKKLVQLEVWWVDEYSGIAHGKEGQEVQWIKPEKLQGLTFPAANDFIVSLLKSSDISAQLKKQ